MEPNYRKYQIFARSFARRLEDARWHNRDILKRLSKYQQYCRDLEMELDSYRNMGFTRRFKFLFLGKIS